MSKINAPLYRDPIYDGATDPMIIKNEKDGLLYMFYTQRRSNCPVIGVSWVHGTDIGIAVSENGGGEWHYIGTADLEFEFGRNTFWAPEIVYCTEDGKYHMYVSYIKGVRTDWNGRATIEHYISGNLTEWTHENSLSFNSDRIIDACVFRLPGGIWRMWYKDERRESHTHYADSRDLYQWEYKGEAVSDRPHEGPNVFELDGRYFMITDMWNGLDVYETKDFIRFINISRILNNCGARTDDDALGHHADVVTTGGRAYIVYFTHPGNGTRSSVQLAELKLENGIIVCERDALIEADLR